MKQDLLKFKVLAPECVGKIDNHGLLAENRILSQYKNDEVLKSMILALGSYQIQDIENSLCQLSNRFNLDACEGVQLDIIGEIVGLLRNGRSDDVYRIALKAKAGANNSNGTINEIIAIWKLVTDATEVTLTEFEPASIEIESNSRFIEGLDSVVRELFRDVTAGGVEINARYYYEDAFAFDGGDPFLKGFSDVNDGLIGGRLSAVIV